MTADHQSNTAALADFLEKHNRAPSVLPITDERDGTKADLVLVPDAGGGWRLVEPATVENAIHLNREKPLRRRGKVEIQTLESMMEYLAKYSATNSTLYADMNGPRLTCILNDNPSGPDDDQTGWGDHRAEYDFPLSDEWRAWMDAAQVGHLAQIDFANFIEDRILEVMEPPAFLKGPEPDQISEPDARLRAAVATLGGRVATPAQLLELSKGLQVNEGVTVKGFNNLDTGERQIQFDTEHATSDAKGKPVRVPNMFIIAIPVFEGGDLFRVPVRLRYRLNQGRIFWHIFPIGADKVFKTAFTEGCKEVAEDCDLPLFYGIK